MSHVTGGGLAANLERVMPVELSATLDRATWTPQPIFDLVRRVGDVPQADLEQTLNCGVGMVALTAAGRRGHGDRRTRRARRSAPGWPARSGRRRATAGASMLTGQHPGW